MAEWNNHLAAAGAGQPNQQQSTPPGSSEFAVLDFAKLFADPSADAFAQLFDGSAASAELAALWSISLEESEKKDVGGAGGDLPVPDAAAAFDPARATVNAPLGMAFDPLAFAPVPLAHAYDPAILAYMNPYAMYPNAAPAHAHAHAPVPALSLADLVGQGAAAASVPALVSPAALQAAAAVAAASAGMSFDLPADVPDLEHVEVPALEFVAPEPVAPVEPVAPDAAAAPAPAPVVSETASSASTSATARIPTTTRKSSSKCRSMPAELAYPTNLIALDAPIQPRRGAPPKPNKRTATEADLGDEDDEGPSPLDLDPNIDPKEAKRIKNTLSARKSRARKQAKIEFLEAKVNDLEASNADLQDQVRRLTMQLVEQQQKQLNAVARGLPPQYSMPAGANASLF
ncbi:hypothetical protein H9P43_007161 [Blastocladiella emersonii ATCC 22665]|nr:hypothetical protein H9P43_007161 [Blastocladiella emersonii ATCC 22665]